MKRKLKHLMLLLCAMSMNIIPTGCKHESIQEDTNNVILTTEVDPVGHLTTDPSSESFIFRTNGGGTVLVRLNDNPEIQITHDDYPGFVLSFWGFSNISDDFLLYSHHESLNGKHLKDRLSNRRTLIFPDGAKLTMIANGVDGPLVEVSIYDLNESHKIDIAGKKLIHSSEDAEVAENLDSLEADGECGGFEITDIGLNYFNSYTEESAGMIEDNYYLLGEIMFDFPNLVNDHFDDPRLGHT